MKPFVNVAVAISILAALTHFLRPVFGWKVMENGVVVPCRQAS